MSEPSMPEQDVPLPPPTLLTLVSGLAAQAMVSLGIFPNPITGQTSILLHQGKHLIDTVAMLSEKTAAVQTPEEANTFEKVLHELRMLFVAAQNEHSKQTTAAE